MDVSITSLVAERQTAICLACITSSRGREKQWTSSPKDITITAPFAVFGLLFDDFLESLGEGTQAVALISNLTASVSCLFGVVINYILTKYSCRKVGVAGSTVFFIGSFTSAFANSAVLLAFAYGVLQGIGLGLMIPAALTNLNNYFLRRRTFAMGVAQVITGIGTMILPIILQQLIEIYGFRGTQLIISGISLHSFLCAVVQIPAATLKKHKRTDVLKIQEYVFDEKSNNGKISLDSETRDVNRKTQNIEALHSHTCEPFGLVSSAVKAETETSAESEASETLGGMQRTSFLKRDENISCENLQGEILTVNSNVRSDQMMYINAKSSSQEEFQATENFSENPSLLRKSNTDNTNGDISVGNLNETVTAISDIKKEFQSIATGHEGKDTESEKYNIQEDYSADKHLPRGDHRKDHSVPNRLSADLTSTTRNHVFISNSRNVVTRLIWSSTCERRSVANDETLVPESADSCRRPNIFSRSWCAVVDFLELRLLLDPVYVNTIFGVGISFFADITYCALFPLIILKLGYSRADSAICISILAAADIFGRLCVTLIGAIWPQITSRTLFFVGSATSVVGRIIFVSFEDFPTMAAFSGYLGFTRSFILVTMPLIMAEYSVQRFPAAFGLCQVVCGIIGLSAGSFVGWVRDITDSYPICINTLNFLQIVICVVPWTLEYAVCRLRAQSKTKQNSTL